MQKEQRGGEEVVLVSRRMHRGNEGRDDTATVQPHPVHRESVRQTWSRKNTRSPRKPAPSVQIQASRPQSLKDRITTRYIGTSHGHTRLVNERDGLDFSEQISISVGERSHFRILSLAPRCRRRVGPTCSKVFGVLYLWVWQQPSSFISTPDQLCDSI